MLCASTHDLDMNRDWHEYCHDSKATMRDVVIFQTEILEEWGSGPFAAEIDFINCTHGNI